VNITTPVVQVGMDGQAADEIARTRARLGFRTATLHLDPPWPAIGKKSE
jgi:hypothetical protein